MRDYFFFLGLLGLCVSADPAALFWVGVDFLSLSTFAALDAAFLDVTSFFFVISFPCLVLYDDYSNVFQRVNSHGRIVVCSGRCCLEQPNLQSPLRGL